MPYDHPQYRTHAVLGSRGVQRHDGAADIEGARAVLHDPGDVNPFPGEQKGSRLRQALDRHTPELHRPVTGLQPVESLTQAATLLLARERVDVTRVMKNGPRTFDVRGAVVSLDASASEDGMCAILR